MAPCPAAECVLQPAHLREGGALRRLGDHGQLAGVGIGDEALRHQQHQQHREQQQAGGGRLHRPRAPQGRRQGAGIGLLQPLEAAVESLQPGAGPGPLGLRRRQHPCGQHRRQGEGHQPREQDRQAEGDGEFAEQAAEQSAQKQDRNEHRHQGDGHREDRRPDLARAAQGGLPARLPLLLSLHDRFHHHDRVIHHKADAEGEGHQRDCVQGIAQPLHRPERGQQRDHNRQGRQQSGDSGAEEQGDHCHHQGNCQQQRQFHIMDRFLNRLRAIKEHLHRNRPWNLAT